MAGTIGERVVEAIRRTIGYTPDVEVVEGTRSLFFPSTRVAEYNPEREAAAFEVAHEIGHGVFTDPGIAAGEFDPILEAIHRTSAYQKMAAEGVSYRIDSDELLAEAFAEHVTLAGNLPELAAGLASLRGDEDAPITWSSADFAGVAEALDAFFGSVEHGESVAEGEMG